MANTGGNATSSYAAERDGNLTSLPTTVISQNGTKYYELADNINFYGLCIVLPFGLLGNSFIVLVLLRSSSLRKTTTGHLLVALAIADSTVLIGEIFRWLCFQQPDKIWTRFFNFPQSVGLNFVDTTSAGCKITHFLRYTGSLWSAWITVAIAVERLIAVAWPLKIITISTPRRVKILIALIAFGGLALGVFPFWTLDRVDEVNGPRCRIINGTSYEVWNDIVIKSFTLAIPSILITVLTVVIICLLYRARIRRRVCLSSPTTTCCRSISVEAQLTIMLVAVCVSTVALRTPYTIAYNIRSSLWYTHHGYEVKAIAYFAYLLTDLINTINYAVNFLLYCLWGSSFRKECKKMLCCCRKDRPVKIGSTSKETSIKCCCIGESPPTMTELEYDIH